MPERIYDTIVVGGGPAGITSSIYLARRKLCILMVYEQMGGQAFITADIQNYSGYRFISGDEFTKRLSEHLNDYDLDCAEEKVVGVTKSDHLFEVKTTKNSYRGKSVVIASGMRQRLLNIAGESEFLNKGVAYCATCDAPLFKGREVAVIGGGNSALEAVIQLEKYAKKIYAITINKELMGEVVLIDKVQAMPNVEIIDSARTRAIKGDTFVSGMTFDKNGKLIDLAVQGVFIEIGYQPNSEFIDIIGKNEYGEIKITKENETSLKGIFAAGDVTDVPVKQIIVAAGEGAKAALSAAEYLSRLRH